MALSELAIGDRVDTHRLRLDDIERAIRELVDRMGKLEDEARRDKPPSPNPIETTE